MKILNNLNLLLWQLALPVRWLTRSLGPTDAAKVRFAKVWILLGLMSLTMTYSGYRFGDRYGLLIGFLLAVILNAWVLFYDDFHIAELFKSTFLEGQDPWGLLNAARDLSSRLDTVCPNVRLVESSTPLAFSAGIFLSRTTIYVSTELLHRFSKDEIRAVIAIEIARLKLRRTSLATMISALTGLVSLCASTLDWIITLRFIYKRPFNLGNPHSKPAPFPIPGPISLVLLPLNVGLIRLAVREKVILQADHDGALALGDNHLVARTIWKLDSYVKALPTKGLLTDMHLYTVSPLVAHRKWHFALAESQIETRIKRLTGHYPL